VVSLGELIFLSVLSVAGLIFGALLLLIYLRTPVFTFLKSGMSRKPLMLMSNKNGEAQFVNCEQRPNTLFNEYGYFNKAEDSHLNLKKPNVSFYFAFNEFSTTIPLYYNIILDHLRACGFNIKKWDNYDKLVKVLNDDSKKSLFLKDCESKLSPEEYTKLISLINNGIKKETLSTIKLNNLQNIFPYNIDPVFIRSNINNEVILKMKQFDGAYIKWIGIGIMILLIFMGFALMYKVMGSGVALPSIDVAGGLIPSTPNTLNNMSL
jgi:hypothetical protein